MKLLFFVMCCNLYSISALIDPKNVVHSRVPRSIRTKREIENAPKNHAPFQCSVMLDGVHACGCVIILSQWVLTAAHCAWQLGDMKIMVGSNDLYRPGLIYDVQQKIAHEDFIPNGFDSDIALLQVNGSFQFDRKVQPIKWISPLDDVPDGTWLELTGWGKAKSVLRSNFLQIIRLKVFSKEACSKMWWDDDQVRIGDGQMCTITKPGEGACHGDSGGPLVLRSNPPVLVGIANFGKAICDLDFPNVFANVTYYKGWIKKHLPSIFDHFSA